MYTKKLYNNKKSNKSRKLKGGAEFDAEYDGGQLLILSPIPLPQELSLKSLKRSETVFSFFHFHDEVF